MKWFQELSPRVKLVLSFLLVSCILSGVSSLALVKMSQINETIESMYSNQLLPIAALGQTRCVVLEVCNHTQSVALADGGQEQQARKLDDFRKSFLETYEHVVVPQATTTEELAMTVKNQSNVPGIAQRCRHAEKAIESKNEAGSRTAVALVMDLAHDLVKQIDEESDFNRKVGGRWLRSKPKNLQQCFLDRLFP